MIASKTLSKDDCSRDMSLSTSTKCDVNELSVEVDKTSMKSIMEAVDGVDNGDIKTSAECNKASGVDETSTRRDVDGQEYKESDRLRQKCFLLDGFQIIASIMPHFMNL